MSPIKNTAVLPPDKLRVLVYGAVGSGKTRFAGTFPRPLFLDTDRGIRSLHSAGLSIDYEDFADVEGAKVYEAALALVKQVDRAKYDTIVLDSLTTFAERTLDYVLKANNHTGQNPTQPDWGMQITKIKEFLNVLVSTGLNVVVIAHQFLAKDEVTQRTWAMPLVTGKLANRIGMYFDEMYHADSEEDRKTKQATYQLQTKATGVFSARSRLDLPMYIAPHYSNLIQPTKGGTPTK